jgi:serine O-acetyltransferase
MENRIEQEIGSIVSDLIADYRQGRSIDAVNIFKQPDKKEIIAIIDGLLMLVYPGYYRDRSHKIYNADNNLAVVAEDTIYHLNKQIARALEFSQVEVPGGNIAHRAQEISVAFFHKIPAVRSVLETDLEAAFEGDPAAKFREEVILSYPGLLAITINRLAHELFLLGVPLIPRIMTEHAHSLTGIDIHPGATIGTHFFIDHGTGIVIGETTIIGEYVKIYQGVTLGALSTRGGQRLRDVKRHPTIEDNVTIYSGASILGGNTIIGENAVIGSNAFITSSVPANTRVSIKNQENHVEPEKHEEDVWYYII